MIKFTLKDNDIAKAGNLRRGATIIHEGASFIKINKYTHGGVILNWRRNHSIFCNLETGGLLLISADTPVVVTNLDANMMIVSNLDEHLKTYKE